jgi:cytochrome b involved in lipid metabolism
VQVPGQLQLLDLSNKRDFCFVTLHCTSLATIMSSSVVMPQVSYSEIKKHSSPDDCWIVLHSKVFDVSAFHAEHPGGSSST